MTYNAELTFKFDATYTHDYSRGFGSTIGDDDFIPEEHFVITAPAADLNTKQYFKLFEKFMLAVGMSPHNIRQGAMSLVFNDYTNEEEQRRICAEYELTMDEDLHKKFKEWKERDEEIERIHKGTDTVADNVEAMYWKDKYIAELSAQGKLEDDKSIRHSQTANDIDSANGVA